MSSSPAAVLTALRRRDHHRAPRARARRRPAGASASPGARARRAAAGAEGRTGPFWLGHPFEARQQVVWRDGAPRRPRRPARRRGRGPPLVERGQHDQLAADESNLDHLAHRAHGGERVLAGGPQGSTDGGPTRADGAEDLPLVRADADLAASVDGAIRTTVRSGNRPHSAANSSTMGASSPRSGPRPTRLAAGSGYSVAKAANEPGRPPPPRRDRRRGRRHRSGPRGRRRR